MFFLSWEFLSCVNNMSLTDLFSNPVVESTVIVFINYSSYSDFTDSNRTDVPTYIPTRRQPGMGVIVPSSLWMFNWMLINAAASYLISWRRFSDSHNVLIWGLGHRPGWCGNHNKVERE